MARLSIVMLSRDCDYLTFPMNQQSHADERLPALPLPVQSGACLRSLMLREEALQAGQQLLWGSWVCAEGLEQRVPAGPAGQRQAGISGLVQQVHNPTDEKTRHRFTCRHFQGLRHKCTPQKCMPFVEYQMVENTGSEKGKGGCL